jgi:hypothetical protein
LENYFEAPQAYCHNHEYNLVFELTSEGLNASTQIVQSKDHIALMWVPLSTLNEIDFLPEPLKIILPEWLLSSSNAPFRSVMERTEAGSNEH